jgi:hypothetical protein
MRNNNRRSQWPVVAAILIILALAAGEAEGLVVLLILGMLLFMVRQFESGTDAARRRPYQSRPAMRAPSGESRQAHAEPVYKHALEAVSAAGLDPDVVQVLPVDVGVMAFKGDSDPVVYRTWAVPDDSDYVQPFVQLRLPTKASGKVRFEIIDPDGNPLFVHEDIHELKRGRNLVTPSARLPVHDVQSMDERWTLRVSADGVLLAVHSFEWETGGSARVRRHMGTDGEISQEMRVVLDENRLGQMSLDDLLSMQDMAAEEAQQQSHR